MLVFVFISYAVCKPVPKVNYVHLHFHLEDDFAGKWDKVENNFLKAKNGNYLVETERKEISDKNNQFRSMKRDDNPKHAGADYANLFTDDDSKYADYKVDKACNTIDGPGEGPTCIFPFWYRGKSYTACTLDGDSSVHQFWCSTKVDAEGVHVSGQWGSCSKECPGVEQEGFIERICETLDSGEECQIPFSYKGFTYHGCVRKHEDAKYDYWCLTKSGKRKFCSESCPIDNLLSKIQLSAQEIVTKLKKSPEVFSKIGDGESCEEAIGKKNMTEICLGANYCAEEKIQSNQEQKESCGSFQISQRMNVPSERFRPQTDCHFACGGSLGK